MESTDVYRALRRLRFNNTAHKTIFKSSGEYFAGSGFYPKVTCAQVCNRCQFEQGSHQSAHAPTCRQDYRESQSFRMMANQELTHCTCRSFCCFVNTKY